MKCVKKLYKVRLKKHYSKSHEKIMYKKIPGCIYLHFYTIFIHGIFIHAHIDFNVKDSFKKK